MITVTADDAKTGFSNLLQRVERDSETILICRRGRPVAEIKAFPVRHSGLPAPDPKLAATLAYDPTEPLDGEELPAACR